MCNSWAFLSHKNNTSFFFLLVSFGEFQWKRYGSIWGHYGFRIVGVFSKPLSKARLLISFGGIGLLYMEDCAPSIFLKNWALVALYLCSRFCIFYRPVLEKYVSQVEEAHTCFNHAYVQRKMAFLLQLRICIFVLKVL
jgi:hypothetical protein